MMFLQHIGSRDFDMDAPTIIGMPTAGQECAHNDGNKHFPTFRK